MLKQFSSVLICNKFCKFNVFLTTSVTLSTFVFVKSSDCLLQKKISGLLFFSIFLYVRLTSLPTYFFSSLSTLSPHPFFFNGGNLPRLKNNKHLKYLCTSWFWVFEFFLRRLRAWHAPVAAFSLDIFVCNRTRSISVFLFNAFIIASDIIVHGMYI